MEFDFERKIGSLPKPDRLLFYELFAHNLTVVIRRIWSLGSLTASEMVDQMKWVNEILHRITAKSRHLRLDEGDWPEGDIAGMIEGWVAQNPAIGQGVQLAIQQSYEAVNSASGSWPQVGQVG